MKLDIDSKQRIKILVLFLLQSYKVVMGSMLLVFVPRKCGDDVCTVSQNLSTDDTFNRVALGFNFTSIFFFFLTYLIELRRENFCVHQFDINHDVGDNNLAIILKNKPKLLKSLHYHNNLYYKITASTFFVYLTNFILSDIVLYNDETFWRIGLAPYFSYILLILMKLYNCYYISSHSRLNDKALSAYITEFSSFNVIDFDMLTDKEKQIVGEQKIEKGPIDIGLHPSVINTIL
jgi:hypothetical protein